MTSLPDLPHAWRDRAEDLRRFSAAAAAAFEEAAEQLDRSLAEAGDTLLTLAEAARESGYSHSHIARLIRERKIPNAGRPKAPRVRWRDLPRKPQSLPSAPRTEHVLSASSRQVVRAIAQGDTR